MNKQNFKPRGQNLKDYNSALAMQARLDEKMSDAFDRGASEDELDRIDAEQTRNTLYKLLAWYPDRHHYSIDTIKTFREIDADNVKKGLIAKI